MSMNSASHPDREARFRACHLLVTLLAASVMAHATEAAAAPPQLGRAKIKDVVAAMTLEEKAALVVGEGGGFGPPPAAQGAPGTPAAPGAAAPPGGGVVGATQRLVPGAAGTTHAVPRLGITSSVLADGPAGLRISPTRPNDPSTYYATAFPVGTLLASTWDTDLVTRVGKAIGNELLEYGVDVLLAPGLNIHRNPLCGRNFEYYSEDPLVTGKMAAAMVGGVESQGVGTSIKHFAANNAETARTALDTHVSERALREIYLEGFRIAVEEAQPWTVMTSYNLINGTYAPESRDLITAILRGDWGFKGYVMTDWGGGKDPVAQMAAGNDLIMPGRPAQRDAIVKAVQEGKLDVKLLDANVGRILELLVQGPRFKGYKFSNKPDLEAHAAVAREAAGEGMVLLKNAGALPLATETKSVAAFGNASYDTFSGGTGSGDVNEAYTVSLAQGLERAGYAVNADLQAVYAGYLKLVKAGRPAPGRGFFSRHQPIAELDVPADLVSSMAALSDVAIVTIGRNAGEGRDRTNSEGDFKLAEAERRLVQQVSSAFQAKGKKAVVVLNTGGSMETASWRDLPDAILLAWQGGQEAGHAVADILSGKVNPSGKLATTFVVDYMDVPSAKTFPGQEIPGAPEPEPPPPGAPPGFRRPKPATITYEDGIYVGYRYYDTFGVKTAYEFGYGLSYTTFDYANLKLGAPRFDRKLVVSVDVKNTGRVAGREVAQLYLSAPSKSLDKPAKELKGFAKTKRLAPGETQTLDFVLDARSLASFDPALSAWVADAGRYEVKVGASSRDIRQTASFVLDRQLVVKKEARALVPKQSIAELKPRARGQAAPAPAAPRQPTPNDTLQSPEVLPDKRVTFRIYAPKASEVTLSGDWVTQGLGTGGNLRKDQAGVWSLTVGPLPGDIYSYTLTVDGVRTVDPKNAWIKQGVASVANMFLVPGEEAAFADNRPVPHGEIRMVSYHSTTLNEMRRMHVYTPPGYDGGSSAYPVLYLIHGGGDEDSGWSTIGRAGFILDNLLAAGKAKPMIVVMPNGSIRLPGVSTTILDRSSPAAIAARIEAISKLHDAFAADLLTSIMPHVEKAYRTSTRREHRAIAGLSMGGAETLRIAPSHSDTFAYVGVFSMGLQEGVNAGMAPDFEARNAAFFARPAETNRLIELLWIASGKNDQTVTDGPRRLSELLTRRGIEHEFHETEGGHTWINWRRYLRDFVPRLFQ